MPTKNKKDKKVIKQKQKQTQKQVVNIKIGDVKKAAVRRRKGNKKPIVKQPVQYMYQAAGQASAGGTTQPQPQIPKAVYETIGVAQPARQNILSPLSAQIQQVLNETENIPNEPPLRIGKSAEPRPSIFGIEEEVNIEPLQNIPQLVNEFSRGLSASQTEAAREVRRAMQISQGAGSDVPIELLLIGRYQNEGQNRRPFPTINQRQRLLQAGYPIAGDEDGVFSSPRKK